MNKRIDNLMYKTSYNRDVNKKLDLQGDVERLQGEIKYLTEEAGKYRRNLEELKEEKQDYLNEVYKEKEKETLQLEGFERDIVHNLRCWYRYSITGHKYKAEEFVKKYDRVSVKLSTLAEAYSKDYFYEDAPLNKLEKFMEYNYKTNYLCIGIIVGCILGGVVVGMIM